METKESRLPNATAGRGESGQSFTEMAISMVLILLILAGIVDLGRMLFIFVSLREAAQEGAAYASFCPADLAGIQRRARVTSTNPIDLSNTTNVTVAIVPNCSLPANAALCTPGNGIRVTISHPTFRMSMPFIGGVNIPISATVIDTILTNTLACPPQ